MGIILSLAATFAPFWQTQVFPLLPEGRMCWCSCQGPTCCREEIKGLGRIRRVRTHTPEKHNSSHIHHPTKGTVEFFTEQEDGASRSSWIRPSEYAIWIPSFFSEHPSHSLVLGRVFFFFFLNFDRLYLGANNGLYWLPRNTIWCDWNDQTNCMSCYWLHVEERKKVFHSIVLRFCSWFFRAMHLLYQGEW